MERIVHVIAINVVDHGTVSGVASFDDRIPKFQKINLGFVVAVVLVNKPRIYFFADVVDAPVLAVEKNDSGLIRLFVRVHVHLACHQPLHHGIAEEGGVLVAARSAEDE